VVSGEVETTGGSQLFKPTATNYQHKITLLSSSVLKFTGPLNASTGSGTSTGLSFEGSGEVIIANASNPIAEPITLNGPTLRVNGSLTATGVNVTSGTLRGNGTIAGAVSIGAAGVISPGNSVDTLHTGNLTFDGGKLVAEVEFANDPSAQPTADQVDVTGDVAINSGSTLQLELLDAPSGTLSEPRTVVIIKNGGSSPVGGTSGEFANFPAGPGTLFGGLVSYTIQYDYNADAGTIGNDVAITFTAVPEPTSGLLLIPLAAAMRRRGRRSSR
jgi:hypothetical protein